MRTLRMVCAAATGMCLVLLAAPAYADSQPAITQIAIDSPACASICFTVTVSSPAPGTITLRLTAHTPAGGGTWVDVGVPHATLNVVPNQTTYQACFGDVAPLIAGRGFNSLRIDVVSWTVPSLQGTTTKSASFDCTSGSGGSGGTWDTSVSVDTVGTGTTSYTSGTGNTSYTSGTGATSGTSGSGSGTGTSGSATGTTTGRPLASTGGFDYRFPLIGLPLVLAGLFLLLVAARRRPIRR